MIVFVSTASHKYTHEPVAKQFSFVKQVAYPVLLARRRLPHATYIFSDFDRLNFWQLEVAAGVFSQLRNAGCRCLNDPASAQDRLTLLQQLSGGELNTFSAWPAIDAELVDKFPVFVRTIRAHRGNLTDLIETPQALQAELKSLVASGMPLSDLMIAEFRAEPLFDDVYRKLAAYRVGDKLFHAPSVHERNWTAKYGELGIAGADAYRSDLDIITSNPFEDTLMKAFDLANVEYGRVDFGLVGGRPEIYEINTNPCMDGFGNFEHPFEDRRTASEFSENEYIEALTEIDGSKGPSVKIMRPEAFAPRSKLNRLLPGYQWTP